MRIFGDPFSPSPDEQLDDALELFELVEVTARRALRYPEQIRRGIEHGRIRFRGPARGPAAPVLVHRRLAFRLSSCTGRVVLRDVVSGLVVRLPFA